MTLTAHIVFRSESTKHIAWNTGKRWQVSWLPERVFTQDQAEAAMNIAELVGTGWDRNDHRITDLPAWAAELGIDPKVAIGQVTDRRAWGCAVRYAHLPWQHKGLLLLLGTYFDTNGVYHRPTPDDLATAMHLAEQHVVDLAMELQGDGWFSWHPVTGTTVNADQPERLLQLDPVPTGKNGADGDAI